MNIKPSLIDLDSIENPSDFSAFDADKLLYLANSIVNLKGLLKIPVVKQINVESYKLVSGFFEYLAYSKALELNPDLPDRLRVFVADSNNETLIEEQIKVFENLEKISESGSLNPPSDLSILISNLSTRINKIEEEIKTNKEEIKTNNERIKIELLQAIDHKIPTPLAPLEAFNQILDPKVTEMVAKKLAFLPKSRQTKIIQRLIEIKKENPDKKFKKFDEVISALGKGYISPEKMLEVIDNWG